MMVSQKVSNGGSCHYEPFASRIPASLVRLARLKMFFFLKKLD
jgi:hypothetical protein